MQTFVNPVTSRQTTFEAAWLVEDLSRGNMLFAISSDQASGGVYFGHEQVPATMSERQYAEVPFRPQRRVQKSSERTRTLGCAQARRNCRDRAFHNWDKP
ncbi:MULTISPECIES: hypothetical protein [unclassified Ensifer]|uniref:hypothetical protein n=1 Tax=unclassified Ensifer TaxID=2633371 RepID=UPI001782A160|nr:MULTISPECIES: hypothetical protein [unclassified Ensifer]MBD9518783.1 hypothetical protein [Ensifer sp. ENS02]